ncbi:MAG: zinc ribbon domain-containing protein [Clostridium sp.]|nr:zinc ribbon domain-containing protein [Acetatifactor muris]MCM1527430.1 zinc ribbon domain-containing protein [Bacteroides sp.]MCM1562435.1 zinc ribbon domain-containing protein [Clostridium sp.]
MSAGIIGIIIILVIILVLFAGVGLTGYLLYRKIHNTVGTYSKLLFGTENPVEGIKKSEMENANRPKSVASATSLYLPRIMKDFPEFHYDEMKTRAENVLVSYLRSVDGMNASLLTEGMEELRENLGMRIQMLQNRDSREHFQRINVHRTEINQYRKLKGRCSVVMQSAVEYIHYVERDGKITEGRKDLKEQKRYNVEVVYIQDRDTVENLGDSGLGLNCPNCGAPLPGLGAKKCLYCDTPVVEFNIRVWNFSSVREV